ncbi:hypothetical protein BU14_0493s0010 [Porphyra umbilicalis]|uniref:Uncharacterized protein n=1 Tax=Porphyra umbilicalis TaxID=2786 RepID=A0A1X6NTH9_PORUM|nr:hypothetical protein BU14_0493s0010 [Porphyra umbilicalis]|eukprot:OSX71865.1 hypothetical protein BU14_0493s0010 [Porphyra umbilicalis]
MALTRRSRGLPGARKRQTSSPLAAEAGPFDGFDIQPEAPPPTLAWDGAGFSAAPAMLTPSSPEQIGAPHSPVDPVDGEVLGGPAVAPPLPADSADGGTASSAHNASSTTPQVLDSVAGALAPSSHGLPRWVVFMAVAAMVFGWRSGRVGLTALLGGAAVWVLLSRRGRVLSGIRPGQ